MARRRKSPPRSNELFKDPREENRMAGRRKREDQGQEMPLETPLETDTAEETTEAVAEVVQPVEPPQAEPARVRVSNPSLDAPEYVPLVGGLSRLDPKGFVDVTEADLTDFARQMSTSGRLNITSL